MSNSVLPGLKDADTDARTLRQTAKARSRSMGEITAMLWPFIRERAGTAAIARALNIRRDVISSTIASYEMRTWRSVDAPFDPPADWGGLSDADRKIWINIGLGAGRSPGQVAVGLGVRPVTFRKWCRREKVDIGEIERYRPGRSVAAAGSVPRLERSDRAFGPQQQDSTANQMVEGLSVWSDQVAGADPVPLIEAGETRCKWPMWTGFGDEPRNVCGAPCTFEDPYCAAHTEISVNPVERLGDGDRGRVGG